MVADQSGARPHGPGAGTQAFPVIVTRPSASEAASTPTNPSAGPCHRTAPRAIAPNSQASDQARYIVNGLGRSTSDAACGGRAARGLVLAVSNPAASTTADGRWRSVGAPWSRPTPRGRPGPTADPPGQHPSPGSWPGPPGRNHPASLPQAAALDVRSLVDNPATLARVTIFLLLARAVPAVLYASLAQRRARRSSPTDWCKPPR